MGYHCSKCGKEMKRKTYHFPINRSVTSIECCGTSFVVSEFDAFFVRLYKSDTEESRSKLDEVVG